jgi:quercetin dioxygenase-like cupin family protein
MPGEGRVSHALGLVTTLKVRSEDSGGVHDVIDFVIPPGRGIPAHLHHRTDESLVVIAGEMTVQLGDRSIAAGPGTVCFIPRGVAHGFGNKTAADCRAVLWVTPGFGFEQFLAEMETLPPGPPDPALVTPILQRYDFIPV